MDIAGKKFIGEHDFRNFCKMDVANVHCYTRRVTFFEVSPCQNRLALVKGTFKLIFWSSFDDCWLH